MEKLSKCPICEGQGFIENLPYKDFSVSKECFSIVSCSQCQFKFTNPRPSELEIGRYYESDDYISHSNSNKGVINKIYKLIRKIAIQKKIQLIESLNTQEK